MRTADAPVQRDVPCVDSLLADPGGGAVVLVVDDDANGRMICKTVLQHYGYRTLEAEEGRTALRLAREHQPAVVILDLTLPGMLGTEVARELRGSSRTEHIRLLAYTAHAGAGVRETISAAGFDAYLAKPCSPIEVVEQVRRLTAGQRRISREPVGRAPVNAAGKGAPR